MSSKEQQRQLEMVRRKLLKGLEQADEVPSTVALSALVELTVDTAVTLCGREQAIAVICETVNILMSTKYRKEK